MSGFRSRRAFLRSSGLAAVSVLGGCATFESGVELGNVIVRNAYSNPHTVHVDSNATGN